MHGASIGRYGVLPGYGISLQDGFEDTFTATATAALEFGSIPYAKGVINNWLLYYVRDNGMTSYRSEELAQAGRMLTICALYVSVSETRSTPRPTDRNAPPPRPAPPRPQLTNRVPPVATVGR
eukprot:COSAG01_NODE_166_length_23296_cov_140.506014_7_plen_123_part_00